MGSGERKRQTLSESDEGDVLSESSMEGEEHSGEGANDDDTDMEGDNNEDVSTQEPSSEKEIEAVFAFYDPSEKDRPFLRELLHQHYKDIKDLNLDELTDVIIRQSTVGTVVRCEESMDDGMVLGVISVLSFDLYRELQCMAQMKAFILEKCQEEEQTRLFREAMESPGVGWMVNVRLLNVPPKVGPPLNQALFEEMAWAQEDEPEQKRRKAFKMDRYVIVTCIYEDPAADPTVTHASKKSKIEGPQGCIYVKPEDEFYHKFSSQWFTFPLESQQTEGEGDLRALRLVMLISHDAALQARIGLDAVVGNAARPDG